MTEQIPAGLSDASCRSQHRLSGLYEDDITTFITLAWPIAYTGLRELSKTDFWIKNYPHWDTDKRKGMPLNTVCGFVATGITVEDEV